MMGVQREFPSERRLPICKGSFAEASKIAVEFEWLTDPGYNHDHLAADVSVSLPGLTVGTQNIGYLYANI